HHEEWIKADYGNAALRDRFDAIWVQIAERFKDKPEKLLFEIINEPFGMTREETDDLNQRVLGLIRETNPTRIVIYSGHNYSGPEDLLAAADPDPDDPYLLAYFHAYNPWPFAGQGQGTWGTAQDVAEVEQMFQAVADWSAQSRRPVIISEFGAVRETPFNDRMKFYATYVSESLRHGMPFQVWDDGGMFGLYERTERTWPAELDILIDTYPDSPTNLAVSTVDDTTHVVTWANRTDRHAGTRIERRRKDLDPTYETIATVPASATSFTTADYEGGQTYLYRVVTEFATGPDWASYPVEQFAQPTVRAPYLGAPHEVPGSFEAEDFDEGGEGLTYRDSDPENIPGAYRPSVGVDLEPRDDGGFHIAYVESGEWVEYTVNVAQAGTYDVTTHVASLNGGGRFGLSFDGVSAGVGRVPRTDSWNTTVPVTLTTNLEAGEQIMRLDIILARFFNVDRFDFALVTSTDAEPPATARTLDVYPNPAADWLRIDAHGPAADRYVSLYDALGRRVIHRPMPGASLRLDTSALPAGLYLLDIDGETRKVVVGR
ncbi:MAG: cellulase family glycosylhydrolase, partial [Bacteroidota bacterium]